MPDGLAVAVRENVAVTVLVWVPVADIDGVTVRVGVALPVDDCVIVGDMVSVP